MNTNREIPRCEKIIGFNKFIGEKEITLTVDKSHTCIEDSSLSFGIPGVDELLKGLPLPSKKRALGHQGHFRL